MLGKKGFENGGTFFMMKPKRTAVGNIYTASYVYNLSGALIEETYPSGRVVKNTLDIDGDLAQVQSRKSTGTLQNYANAFTYTSAGAVSSLRLGNGKFENETFNSRLQPIQIGLGSSATSQNLLKLNFDYGLADNNGNVKSQQITVQQGNPTPLVLNQNYVYDSLNRLKSAKEKDANNIQVWKQTYVFDRYGNRNFDTANNNTTNLVGTLPKVTNPEILPTNNRLKADQDGDNVVDYLYDASGNLIQDVDNKRYGYDAENKQVQYFASNNQTTTPTGTYFFDGDGKRVKKISPTETTTYVYDAGGKLVAEYSTQQADTPKINYTTNDHLGSPRITTNQNGQVISRTDYQPYGEEIASTQRTASLGYTVQDSVKQGFTGYIKDDETGLDFAQARMYKKELGRFTGADPLLLSGRIENPKTWNRYAYVLNNPLYFVDPSGLYEYVAGTSDKDKERIDGAYKKLVESRGKFKEGSKKYNAIDRSIKALGKPGEKNGVMVFVDNTLKTPGEANGSPTIGNDDRATGKADVYVGINLSKFATDDSGKNGLAGAFGHEGSHVADYQSEAQKIKGFSYSEITAWSESGKVMSRAISEVNAYRVSSYIAEAISPSNTQNVSVNQYDIWNRGWSSADEDKNRNAGIRGILEAGWGSYKFKYSPNSIPLSVPGANQSNSIDNKKQWKTNGGPLF
jgi:RHS repeat-associated protein